MLHGQQAMKLIGNDMYDFYVVRDPVADAEIVGHTKYIFEDMQGEIIFKGTKYECKIFLYGFQKGQDSCTHSF
jgi:hypothetical protein